MSQRTMINQGTRAQAPLPTGPRGHPLLGMLPAYRRDPLALYARLAHTYGDVARVRFLWVNTYAVSHPDAIKYVVQEHHRNYRRDAFLTNILEPVFGHNLFTAEGERWFSRRRLMQPAFHRQQIAGFGTLMTAAAEAMLARWDAHPADTPLAIDQEMMQVTLHIAGQALFGVDLLGAAHDLGAAFTAYSELINYRVRTPFPAPLWWPTRLHRRFQAAAALVERTVQGMIAARRATPPAPHAPAAAAGATAPSHATEGKPNDLLAMLMAARDADTGQGMSDEDLRHEIAMMMFAGHETTAVALTWTLYLLSRHPGAARTLHAELAEVLTGRTPTIHDVPALRYTRMVIDEALRLYPPAWAVGRQAIRADEIGGYRIPAGSSVTLVINNVHRDPRWWDCPEQFDPERFTPERAARRLPYAYLPFGGGPRGCIGQTFALTEMTLVLATLAQRYHLRLVPGHPVTPDPIFALRTSHGLPMMLLRR